MKKRTRWYISPRFEKRILDSAETLFQGRCSNLAAIATGMSQKLTSNLFFVVESDILAHCRWTCMQSGIGFGSLENLWLSLHLIQELLLWAYTWILPMHMFFPFSPRSKVLNAASRPESLPGSRIGGCDWGGDLCIYHFLSSNNFQWNDINDPDDTDSC